MGFEASSHLARRRAEGERLETQATGLAVEIFVVEWFGIRGAALVAGLLDLVAGLTAL